MIWVTDADGYLIYVSSEWESLTGQAIEDARGLGWLKKVHADDRGVLLELFFEASSDRQPYTFEYRLLAPSGSFQWVSASAAPSILPDDGKFLGYLGAVKVTEAGAVPAKAAGRIGVRRTPSDLLGETPVTAIEDLADQLMLARAMAENVDEKMLLTILDVALIEVGRRLAQDQKT